MGSTFFEDVAVVQSAIPSQVVRDDLVPRLVGSVFLWNRYEPRLAMLDLTSLGLPPAVPVYESLEPALRHRRDWASQLRAGGLEGSEESIGVHVTAYLGFARLLKNAVLRSVDACAVALVTNSLRAPGINKPYVMWVLPREALQSAKRLSSVQSEGPQICEPCDGNGCRHCGQTGRVLLRGRLA